MNDMTRPAYPLEAYSAEIDGIEHTTDPKRIRVKSRDRYAVSPILKEALAGKTADIVVSPKTDDELRRVLSAAVRHRIPVTVRAAGSANYGQSVPLKGGIVLDCLGLTGIVELKDDRVRVRGGMICAELDAELRKHGKELRFPPTTARIATVAGHFAGGQGGPGSTVYGTWRDPGNVISCTVMTMEEEPRLLELRGLDAQFAHHTYGATGIITEMELPLAPAWAWNEAIVTFDDYMDAVRFGVTLADSAGITRKFVSVHEWPTPSFVKPFQKIVPEGKSILMTMIADQSWESFAQMAERAGGTIVTQSREGEGPYGQPLWEFIFGHMLFQIQKSHPERSVIEGFFRADDLVGLIDRVHEKVKHYGPLRMELLRIGGQIVGSGSPYFVFESPEQMAQMVRDMQEAGAVVSNSHTSNVRAVGKKEITDADLAFKRMVDPHGLLNPGRFEVDEADDAAVSAVELPTDKWDRRLG
ncbi:FAD-binding oxidoreductase [Mangrovicoccus sp. HB161399]|uniref:FAD-binding oxidoreductase n=1 Tax=Mangrovicoccus sp. HB161399 TaxID=2720392 RepID=UPI0015583202|nr:FAD-binding oxidoreductase [Mangrovicoccus sp. HB161399]